MFAFWACKEDPGLIGLDVQPQDEYLNADFFDTTTIDARSVHHDSLVTSNVKVNMLGYMHDPIFGKTQASIYTQFNLSAKNATFGDSIRVDSLVLTLAYDGHYGDTLNSFRVKVYELTEGMEKRKNYYAHDSLNHEPTSLTENPNLYISPRPNSGNLRIKLDPNFAKTKFIEANSSVYASDDNFTNHFKGFLIEAESMTGDGCIASLNMTHSNSVLTMYYSNSKASNQKEEFKLSDSTVHFGAVNHFGYADAEANLISQLAKNYTTAKDVLYAQAGSGVKVLFNFPHIKSMFSGKKVIIHRASLVISHMDDNVPNYFAPSSLWVTSTDISHLNFLPDYILGASEGVSNYFGGGYNKTDKEYRFHITQYIQNLADGSGENFELSLLTNPTASSMNRLKIYGTQPADLAKRLRLEVYYTIIEK